MKKYFFTGLVTLLPLAITFWFIRFLVNFLTKPFVGIVKSILNQFPLIWNLKEQGIQTLSQILVLICLFLITLFLGFVARRFFFHQLIQFGDKVLKKIPLVNKVYKTTKEIVDSLFKDNQTSFKKAVLIAFPNPDSYSIGIVVSNSPPTCKTAANQEEMVSVFIPSTPNPTTGFLVMSPEKDLIYLDIKSEDAIKYVVSCAVVQPNKETLP